MIYRSVTEIGRRKLRQLAGRNGTVPRQWTIMRPRKNHLCMVGTDFDIQVLYREALVRCLRRDSLSGIAAALMVYWRSVIVLLYLGT